MSHRPDGVARIGNQPTQLSPADVLAIYNEPLKCLVCNGDQWYVANKVTFNPIAGPEAGIIPREPFMYCQRCDAPIEQTFKERARLKSIAAEMKRNKPTDPIVAGDLDQTDDAASRI